MNYLAHVYLASNDPESVVGNLMGDFLKGDIDPGLPLELRRGIRMHRQVDVFTDQHPVFLQSKRRLKPEFRRYAGILVDVFYDHILARYWDDYAIEPLHCFTERVYDNVECFHHLLPERMQRTMRFVVDRDLLTSYRELSAIALTLKGISGRLSRANPVANGIEELMRLQTELAEDFERFLPDLVQFVDQMERNDTRADLLHRHRVL